MKETLRKFAAVHARGTVPSFAVAPPMRCYFSPEGDPRTICGALATHRRVGQWWFEDAFFCDAHATKVDVPIDGERVFRRVRFTVDVLLAGASVNCPIANAEALARLEAAVESIGGLLDVQSVLSTIGRYRPLAG